MNVVDNTVAEARYLVDPYLDWTKAEGLPIVEDFCVNLHTVATAPWPRLGINGAIVHMLGRGDLISLFLLDIPPGGKTTPQRHLYEEMFYVISGYGTGVYEDSKGRKHEFEWGPRSMFALPLNAPYQLFNASGREPARVTSTNNFCMMIKAFRDDKFIFDNPFVFLDREPKEGYVGGAGRKVTGYNRQMWETSFVPDLGSFALNSWSTRGAGSGNMVFVLGEGTMHGHVSEMPVGTYKKAHRHGPDFHVFIVKGTGFSLFWYEGEKDFRRFDWGEGCVFAPTDMLFHQHFNTGNDPVRYAATAYGSSRYPFSAEKLRNDMGVDVSVKQAGGSQIEYTDQDPRIHRIYLDELAKNGVKCRMGEFVDEKMLLGQA